MAGVAVAAVSTARRLNLGVSNAAADAVSEKSSTHILKQKCAKGEGGLTSGDCRVAELVVAPLDVTLLCARTIKPSGSAEKMSHDHSHAEGHGGHNAIEIHVKGMHCPDCEAKLLQAINSLPESAKFHDATASHATGHLSMCVEGDPAPVLAAVQRAIEATGYHYEGCGHAEGGHSHGHGHSHSH